MSVPREWRFPGKLLPRSDFFNSLLALGLDPRGMKLMDLEFANEVLTAEGETVDKAAPKRWRADAAAEKAEAFRKGR